MFAKIEIPPLQFGILYKDNKFYKRLQSGIYRFFDFSRYRATLLPDIPCEVQIYSQEILSKDNIAFRASFVFTYEIVASGEMAVLSRDDLENRLRTIVQLYARSVISALPAQEIAARTFTLDPNAIGEKVSELGIKILSVDFLDITFPKAIQALFARELEANLRAKIELENARTVIATTRALKNAAAMIKDDKEMKFLQVMELLQNAVKTGRNTLNVCEMLAE